MRTLFVVLFWLPLMAFGEAGAPFLIGWGSADITPQRQIAISGGSYLRIAEEVQDPLTVTALALTAGEESVVLVGCDLRSIHPGLLEKVRSRVCKAIPGLSPQSVILNATHTHTAPPLGGYGLEKQGVQVDAMLEDEYQTFAVPRIAEAVEAAWKSRKPGGISFGLTYAVLGRNRIIAYKDGKSKMYGKTNTPEFSHVEGYEDHSVNLLCTWDQERKLTGVIINVAMPSQVFEGATISADFWHDTREQLRRKIENPSLFVLPQCSVAGDQSPRELVLKKAEERMQKLMGKNRRQMIAHRLSNAVVELVPVIQEAIEWHPVLKHEAAVLPLPKRLLSDADVEDAKRDLAQQEAIVEAELGKIRENPDLQKDVRNLRNLTRANWLTFRAKRTMKRFEEQKTEPFSPAEVHAIRLGEVGMAYFPFEIYLDYGIQIKARSAAEQTFLVQLSGSGSYVPTERSIRGGAYGAIPASNLIGAEGGAALVEWTVKTFDALWGQQQP